MDLGDADMPKSCPKPRVFLGLLPPQGVVDNYDANRLGVVDIYGGPRLLRRLEYTGNKARPRYNKAKPRYNKARPHYTSNKARPRYNKARPFSRAAA